MKRVYYVFVFLAMVAGLHAQGTFHRSYDFFGSFYHSASFHNIVQVSDGGFVTAGSVNEANWGHCCFIILKTDSIGNPEWIRQFSAVTIEYISNDFDIIETPDGELLFGTYGYGNDVQMGILVKLTIGGDIIWSRKYASDSGHVRFTRLALDSSSHIIVMGNATVLHGSSEDPSSDILMMRLDGSGDILEQTTIGILDGHLSSYELAMGDSGNFYISASKNSYGVPDILIKTNQSFDPEWAKVIEINPQPGLYLNLRELAVMQGDNILLSGNYYDSNYDLYFLVMAELDGVNGSLSWNKIYRTGQQVPEALVLDDIIIDVDDNIVGCGSIGNSGTLVFFADGEGNINTSRRISMPVQGENFYGFLGGSCVLNLASEKYVVGGNWSINEIIEYQGGFHLLDMTPNGSNSCIDTEFSLFDSTLTLSMGSQFVISQPGTVTSEDFIYPAEELMVESFEVCSLTGIPDPLVTNSFVVSPNPNAGKFTIFFERSIRNGVLKIYNLLGNEVYSGPASLISPDGTHVDLDINIAPGIYIVELSDEKERITQKVIVHRK